MSKHVAVWLDHNEAHVFHVERDEADEVRVSAPHHRSHRHPGGATGAKEHPDDAKKFFQEIARALEGAEQVLVVGPSTAKLEFLRHLQQHDHALERRVVGVETVDHPSHNQLVAFARQYFKRTDRML